MDETKYEARATPFAVTFCKYLPGDRVGGLSCLLSLTPMFVLISLGTLLLSRRDPATLTLILGLILSTLFNDYLKLVIKEPRPCSDRMYCSLSEGDVYGMPSGHTQFQAFAAAYITLWALCGRWREPSLLLRVLTVVACWASVACVGASRLYLHYHTTKQVAVGGALGVALATVWYAGVERLRPAFAALAASPVGRWLRIRDCSEVDTLLVEYAAVAAAAAVAAGGGAPQARRAAAMVCKDGVCTLDDAPPAPQQPSRPSTPSRGAGASGGAAVMPAAPQPAEGAPVVDKKNV